MSLKQFPSKGTFTGHTVQVNKDDKPPPRNVAQVFDVDQAWDMLDKRRGEIGEELAQIEGLAALGRVDAARIAAAAGVTVDANFTIAQAVDTFRKVKFREIQGYLLFITLFCLGYVIRADRDRANILMETVQNVLMQVSFVGRDGHYKRFEQISTTEDFWAYSMNGMPQFLYSNNNFNTKSLSPDLGADSSTDLLWVMKYNLIVQPIRIRQIRSSSAPLSECGIAIRLTNDHIDCWPRYDTALEDTAPIPGWPAGTLLEYKTEEDILTKPYGRFTSTTYSGGGFVIDLPQLTSESDYRAMFEHLRGNEWTSKATRAIFYDLAMYNPALKFYISVRLGFEFQPYGSVLPTKSFRVFKGPSLSEATWDVVGFYFQQLVYLGVLGLLIWDVVKLRQMGSRHHFSNAWNMVSFVNYIVFFIAYSTNSSYLGADAFAFFEQALGDTAAVPQTEVFDFEALGAQYNQYECLTGVNALLTWIRLLEYVKYFHKEMAQLMSTTAKCAADCSVWILMLFIILFAYAQAFYISFGPDVAGFNSFGEALTTMVIWAFDVVDLSTILTSDQVLASLLFVSFQVIFTIVLVNMFIVVLMRSYAERSANQDVDPIANEVRKSIKVKVKRFMERVMNLLPAVPTGHDDDDDEILKTDDDGGTGPGDGASSLLGRAKEVKMEDVRTVLAQMQTVHLEVKFLAERVSDCQRRQHSLNRSFEDELEHAQRGARLAQHRDASGRFKLTRRTSSEGSAKLNHAAHVAVSGEGFGAWRGGSDAGSAPPSARHGAQGAHGGAAHALGGEADSDYSHRRRPSPRRGGGSQGQSGGRRGVDLGAYRGLEMAWLPSNTAMPRSDSESAAADRVHPFLDVDG